MSLLRDIQSDIINPSRSISDILRMCKLLATRLGNNEFNLWVEQELNGYQKKEDLPNYRILDVQSYGNFSGLMGRRSTNSIIPPSCIPSEYHEYITHQYLLDPISYYESLITAGEKVNEFKVDWEADLIAYVSDKIYHNMNCTSAWKLISRGSIVALLDTVRNHILSFVIDIENRSPEAGDAPSNVRLIPEDQVTHSFNNIIIQGNVNNLAAGDQMIINIVPNNLNSLRKYLLSLGIDDQDLNELEEAIDEDKKCYGQKKFGDKVGAWMGKMINKAANGTWKVAVSTAGALLAKAISAYFGIG